MSEKDSSNTVDPVWSPVNISPFDKLEAAKRENNIPNEVYTYLIERPYIVELEKPNRWTIAAIEPTKEFWRKATDAVNTGVIGCCSEQERIQKRKKLYIQLFFNLIYNKNHPLLTQTDTERKDAHDDLLELIGDLQEKISDYSLYGTDPMTLAKTMVSTEHPSLNWAEVFHESVSNDKYRAMDKDWAMFLGLLKTEMKKHGPLRYDHGGKRPKGQHLMAKRLLKWFQSECGVQAPRELIKNTVISILNANSYEFDLVGDPFGRN